LAGNLLIKDRDDVFFLPQNIRDYNRMVTFDFGSSMSVGNGGLVFGNDDLTFGVFAHKTDYLGAIPTAFRTVGDFATMNPGGTSFVFDFAGTSLMSPMNWVDAIVGFGDDDMPWGVRVSLGSSAVKDDLTAGGTDDNNSTAFNVVGGTTINNEVEVSAEFTYLTATDETTAGKLETSPIHFAAAVRRTATEEREALSLGYLGAFSFMTGSFDNGTSTDYSQFAIAGGVGPVYMPHERTTVAMYGTVEYSYMKVGDDPTATAFTIPGVNIASEVELASWLQARAGLRSQYVLMTDEINPNAGATKTTTRTLSYDWYSGIGITIDSFMIDGYFNPSVITTGTDLLGNSSQLFGMVTATFMY
jgi:hypothetical protein